MREDLVEELVAYLRKETVFYSKRARNEQEEERDSHSYFLAEGQAQGFGWAWDKVEELRKRERDENCQTCRLYGACVMNNKIKVTLEQSWCKEWLPERRGR